MEQVKQWVRVAGWLAAGVGVIGTANGLCSLGFYVVDLQPAGAPSAPSLGLMGDLVFGHWFVVMVVYTALAALTLVSGVELAQRKEAGRRRLVQVLWAGIPFLVLIATVMMSGVLAMPILPSELTDMLGVNGHTFRALFLVGFAAGTLFMLGIAALLYLAIRWLNSPRVREVCRATGVS